MYQRRYRERKGAKDFADDIFLQTMDKETIDEDLCNYSRFGAVPDHETALVLRYLSHLHRHEKAEAFAAFELGGDGVVRLCNLNFMCESGMKLLNTHSDVIFCDSMWCCCNLGFKLLTIVVIDMNGDIRLAAVSMVEEENEDTWRSFFVWVKDKVPGFKPQTVVSDDASYIFKGFKSAMGRKDTLHIVCWWHQRKNVLKDKGRKRNVGLIFLKMIRTIKKDDVSRLEGAAYKTAGPKMSKRALFKKRLERSKKNITCVFR